MQHINITFTLDELKHMTEEISWAVDFHTEYGSPDHLKAKAVQLLRKLEALVYLSDKLED